MDDLFNKITRLLSSRYPSIKVDSIKMEHRILDDIWAFSSRTEIGVRELVYEIRTTNNFSPTVNNTNEVSEWFFVMTKMIINNDINIRVEFLDPYIKRTHTNYLY